MILNHQSQHFHIFKIILLFLKTEIKTGKIFSFSDKCYMSCSVIFFNHIHVYKLKKSAVFTQKVVFDSKINFHYSLLQLQNTKYFVQKWYFNKYFASALPLVTKVLLYGYTFSILGTHHYLNFTDILVFTPKNVFRQAPYKSDSQDFCFPIPFENTETLWDPHNYNYASKLRFYLFHI